MINQNTNSPIGQSFSYEEAFHKMEQTLVKVIRTSPLVIRRYVEHLEGAKGKYIRAASILACAMGDQDQISENVVIFAAGIELLHLATLVHDDVIDDADIRRGIPTLQKQFGKKNAVICGDYLLSRALSIFASMENLEQYLTIPIPDYIEKICAGELLQLIHNNDFELTQSQYFKIIRGKTAALFEASFYGGAVLCGCSKEEYPIYKRLGRYIGMIFQLTDDCMDYESQSSMAKKPVRSDLEQKVITLPLIHALKKMPRLLEGAELHSLPQLYQKVIEAGGLFYTKTVAEKYYQKALTALGQLSLTPEKESRILLVLQKACRKG